LYIICKEHVQKKVIRILVTIFQLSFEDRTVRTLQKKVAEQKKMQSLIFATNRTEQGDERWVSESVQGKGNEEKRRETSIVILSLMQQRAFV